uniref:Zn(2)-C6 fungal-type domain-containing protein n=1 Tax=Kwoniella pini CBS 10737 TaxID=1296096 RepID=A0A1B9HYG2_9TREE|nr:uncharacterized protein I206_06175 [Kwoniella pini CBS 10737]OCF48307.1 hypothetical protein I206_06175 [Kwoniella pini CBS 10737]
MTKHSRTSVERATVSSIKSTKKRNGSISAIEERPARRALSCTECKRRKTKCSALGKTPCDSCARRGKPQDCKWEGLITASPDAHCSDSGPSIAHNDTDVLRAQIDRLERLVDTLTNRTAPPPMRAAQFHLPDNLESAAIDLEHFVVGPGVRPGLTETLHPTDKIDHRTAPRVSSIFPLSSLFTASSIDPSLLTVLPQLLPNAPDSQRLVDAFFEGPINGSWHVIAQQAFRLKFSEYAILGLDDLEKNVDPLWFAEYLMVLAFAIKFPTFKIGQDIQLFGSELQSLPSTLHHASVKVLEASDYLSRPQIGHVQHFGHSTDQANVALRYLDNAITTAQWLELDSIEDTLPFALTSEPSLDGLEPPHQIELCKQLYHLLNFLDGTIFKRPGLWRLTNSDYRERPCNNNDLDYAIKQQIRERPPRLMTEASLSRIGSSFADIIRDFEMERNPQHTALQRLLDHMPTIPSTAQSWMMNTLSCSLHYRLIRIHRSSMIRGFRDDRWRLSTSASVSSAQRILDIQVTMANWPDLRPGFMRRWIVGAVIIQAIDSLMSDSIIHHIRSQIQRICIDDFSALLPPITAILDSVDHFWHTLGVRKGQLDVDAFFAYVKERLKGNAGPPSATLEAIDIDQFLSTFDQYLPEGSANFLQVECYPDVWPLV